MKDLLLNLDSQSLVLLQGIGLLAQQEKMSAYLVGGPVRDLLLKKQSLDLDITVEGQGMVLAEAFAASCGGKVVLYPAFKTATVRLPDGRIVDFVTARKEIYPHPGVFPAVKPSTLKDDLFRRDFTMNAIAISINPKSWGKVIDPFGGAIDLRSKRIRILHDQSFHDDPTRILRAARFTERFHFFVERKTLKLLKSAIHGKAMDSLKGGRIAKEMKKINKEKNQAKIVKRLESWGL